MGITYKQYFLLETQKYLNYELPADKERQIYDFYLIQMLQGLLHIREQHPGKIFSRLPQEKIDNLKEIEAILAKKLKTQILKAVFFSIVSELYHYPDLNFKPLVSARNTPQKFKLMANAVYKVQKQLASEIPRPIDDNTTLTQKLKTRSKKLSQRYKDLEKEDKFRVYRLHFFLSIFKKIHASYKDIVEFAQYAFHAEDVLERDEGYPIWTSGYGGPLWGDICKQWLNLYDAKTVEDISFYIDRINQLEHNNNTVFDKVEQYAIYNGYEWLTQALDTKFNARYVQDFFQKCTPALKSIAKQIQTDYLLRVQGNREEAQRASSYDPSNPQASDSSVEFIQLELMDYFLPSQSYYTSYTVTGYLGKKHIPWFSVKDPTSLIQNMLDEKNKLFEDDVKRIQQYIAIRGSEENIPCDAIIEILLNYIILHSKNDKPARVIIRNDVLRETREWFANGLIYRSADPVNMPARIIISRTSNERKEIKFDHQEKIHSPTPDIPAIVVYDLKTNQIKREEYYDHDVFLRLTPFI